MVLMFILEVYGEFDSESNCCHVVRKPAMKVIRGIPFVLPSGNTVFTRQAAKLVASEFLPCGSRNFVVGGRYGYGHIGLQFVNK